MAEEGITMTEIQCSRIIDTIQFLKQRDQLITHFSQNPRKRC